MVIFLHQCLSKVYFAFAWYNSKIYFYSNFIFICNLQHLFWKFSTFCIGLNVSPWYYLMFFHPLYFLHMASYL